MTERIIPNESPISAQPRETQPRVVSVEIGELILDGFGPLGSRHLNAGPRDSGRQRGRRPGEARAAAAFRRELARELAVAGPAAEQLASVIADAVLRQLTATPGQSGAR
jgi:hypothetical protein